MIAALAGLEVVQVPVSMRVRTTGRPSQTPFQALAYLLRAGLALAIARVRWHSARHLEPGRLVPVANRQGNAP